MSMTSKVRLNYLLALEGDKFCEGRENTEPLLTPAILGGKVVYQKESLADIRERVKREVAALPERGIYASGPRVFVVGELSYLTERLARQYGKQDGDDAR